MVFPIALGVALATPVIGLAVLLVDPSVDEHWHHDASHFWIVLGAAARPADRLRSISREGLQG